MIKNSLHELFSLFMVIRFLVVALIEFWKYENVDLLRVYAVESFLKFAILVHELMFLLQYRYLNTACSWTTGVFSVSTNFWINILIVEELETLFLPYFV